MSSSRTVTLTTSARAMSMRSPRAWPLVSLMALSESTSRKATASSELPRGGRARSPPPAPPSRRAESGRRSARRSSAAREAGTGRRSESPRGTSCRSATARQAACVTPRASVARRCAQMACFASQLIWKVLPVVRCHPSVPGDRTVLTEPWLWATPLRLLRRLPRHPYRCGGDEGDGALDRQQGLVRRRVRIRAHGSGRRGARLRRERRDAPDRDAARCPRRLHRAERRPAAQEVQAAPALDGGRGRG